MLVHLRVVGSWMAKVVIPPMYIVDNVELQYAQHTHFALFGNILFVDKSGEEVQISYSPCYVIRKKQAHYYREVPPLHIS